MGIFGLLPLLDNFVMKNNVKGFLVSLVEFDFGFYDFLDVKFIELK